MYKVGDRVRVVYVLDGDAENGIKEGGIYRVTNIYSNGSVTIDAPSERYVYMTPRQIKKVEESKEMTFPEMVQKLIDGEFEVGTELVRDDGVSSYFVDNIPYDNKYGLTRNLDSVSVLATVGAIDLNAKWTVKEEPIKEMSIEELQKELGYKIKIVEHESK